MTSAEYQAQFGQKGTAKRTAPARPPKSPPAPLALPRGPENAELPRPTFGALPGPCSWIVAGQWVALAAPLDPARHRLVLTGPADAGLVAAVLAAVAAYSPTPPSAPAPLEA